LLILLFNITNNTTLHIPVAERPKVRVCGLSLAEVEDSNPARSMDICVVCVVQ
jgi:hypothetical protein